MALQECFEVVKKLSVEQETEGCGQRTVIILV